MNISIDRLKQQKRFPYKQRKKNLGQKRSVLAINVSTELRNDSRCSEKCGKARFRLTLHVRVASDKQTIQLSEWPK